MAEMRLTRDNKIELSEAAVKTVDLKVLDLEIVGLKGSLAATQDALDKKQALRDSIAAAFPELEKAVYPVTLDNLSAEL